MDASALRKERGARLAIARRRAAMPAEELVRRLAVVTDGRVSLTSAAVYAWEKGRNLLSEKVATQLAPILGCPASELLGPISTDELELIPLGGASAHQEAKTNSATRPCSEELDVELTVRSRTNGSVLRKRSWRIDIDLDKSELVIRAGEGCSSDSLKLFRPGATGVEELKGRPDYRDLGALRIPFDFNDLPLDDDTPALFLQQILEAVPIFANELPQLFDETPEPVSKAIVRRRLSKDIQFELADFLDDETAQRLTAMWEESSESGEHLTHYCDRILTRESDPFRQRLQEALIYTSLLKNHEKARTAIEFLEPLAGDDPRRLADVAYLSGRNRWYLGADRNDRSELERAIEDLTRSLKLAQASQNAIRVGQAFVYLARIGVEHANYRRLVEEKTGQDLIQLIDLAKDIGLKHRRLDIEALAERLHVIRLYNESNHDESIARGKRLLERLGSATAAGLEFSNIELNLAIHIGLALRRRNQDGDRQYAEQIYLDAISRGRNDSTAGMAMYLLGDIYADRMLDSTSAAVLSKSESQRSEEQNLSEQHRIKAQEWYDQALQTLKSRGDRKALAKAVYRAIWIRCGEHSEKFPEASTRQLVAMSNVAREHFINQRLIGKNFNAQTRSIPMELLEEILTVRHLDANVTHDEVNTIHATDYIDSRTLLLLPSNLGTVLMVQLFAMDDASQVLNLKGWIAIPSYSSEVLPLLRQFRQDATRPAWTKEEFAAFQQRSLECWLTLVGRIEVIEPLRSFTFDRLVVIAPNDHIDAMLPFETLITIDESAAKLLSSVGESVLYAGPWGSPLHTARVIVPANEIAVFADHTEMKDVGSSRGRGRSLLDIVALETAFIPKRIPDSGEALNSTGIAIFAHSDSTGSLRDIIRSWKLDGVRAVFLIFCGSGTFDLISGPFSDGLAQSVRSKLGPNAIVVSNRLPISAAEGIRLLQAVRRDSAEDRPLANVVTNYMQERLREHQNPFTFPWFVL